MDTLYVFIGIAVVWFFLGMAIEWFIVNLLDIEPKSKIGKGVLFFINLPLNLFIYTISIISTAVIVAIVWLFAKIFGKSKAK